MRKILQAFKKLFQRKKEEDEDEVIYLCDASKAKECSKAGCWWISQGPCKCTKRKAYAQRDKRGKPVVASDEDIFNLEYMEGLIN